ncbi:MAG TPA: thymidine kinase [Candidatus Krumholzibacteria bacterium]|nr:thymidine kinase [Candidatus Krumholzibacteria bacterium]HPD71207.1 thymidine kinase [Candidatus Krumholzibacteria bacterium]HRY39093.1 thymidine kinase [Candidatus Krumholzibacteria bacterium]
MQIVKGKAGWIEVICGPMFSGKSEELIRRIRRAEIARQRVQIFKHAIDARYDAASIVSHSRQSLPSIAVDAPRAILEQVDDRTELVAVDEAQFFSDELVAVCDRLANLGKRVVVAGLDLDYRGRPFGPVPTLMCRAEYVTKQLAICMVCGDPAAFTQRLTQSRDQIQVGATGMYEARCRHHFEVPDARDAGGT